MAEKVKFVVLIHHGLGDVIMSLPLLADIDRQCAADESLLLIVKSEVEEGFLRLLDWKAPVACIGLGHSGSWNYKDVLKVALQIRRMEPSVFLAPHASNGLAPALFSKIIGASMSVGPSGTWSWLGFRKKVSAEERTYKGLYYRQFGDIAGIASASKADLDTKVVPLKKCGARETVRPSTNSATIVIAPGSSPLEVHKRWPPEHFRDLIRLLLDDCSRCNILLVGSPSETQLIKEIRSGFDPVRVDFLAQPSLLLLIRRLREASVFVSACTGTAHLAALLDVPVVGIFGPTDPLVTGARCNKYRIVSKQYDCSPCYRKGFEMGCGTPICMTDIQPSAVKEAIYELIELKI